MNLEIGMIVKVKGSRSPFKKILEIRDGSNRYGEDYLVCRAMTGRPMTRLWQPLPNIEEIVVIDQNLRFSLRETNNFSENGISKVSKILVNGTFVPFKC